jgi:hypothetical protein
LGEGDYACIAEKEGFLWDDGRGIFGDGLASFWRDKKYGQ